MDSDDQVFTIGVRGFRKMYSGWPQPCNGHLESLRRYGKGLTKLRTKAFTFSDNARREGVDLDGQFLHASTDHIWKELYLDLQWWILDYWLPILHEIEMLMNNPKFCEWDFENSSFRWMEQRADKIFDTYYQPDAMHASGVPMRGLPTFQHLQDYRLWIKTVNACWYGITDDVYRWCPKGSDFADLAKNAFPMLTIEQLTEHDANRVPGTILNFYTPNYPELPSREGANGNGNTPSEDDPANLSNSADGGSS